MSTRRAMLKEADLRRMARVVRDERVQFSGRVDALGNLSFQISPEASNIFATDDDIDSRIDQFGAK